MNLLKKTVFPGLFALMMLAPTLSVTLKENVITHSHFSVVSEVHASPFIAQVLADEPAVAVIDPAATEGEKVSPTTQEALHPDDNLDFVKLLIQSIGGLAGMKALAIAGLIVQLAIKFINLPIFGKVFSNVSGSMKLLIVSGLTMVAAPIGLMTQTGLSLGAALIHSTTLAAVMVFGNQILQQYKDSKAQKLS